MAERASPEELRSRRLNPDEGKSRCPECSAEFPTPEEVRAHMTNVHRKTTPTEPCKQVYEP